MYIFHIRIQQTIFNHPSFFFMRKMRWRASLYTGLHGTFWLWFKDKFREGMNQSESTNVWKLLLHGIQFLIERSYQFHTPQQWAKVPLISPSIATKTLFKRALSILQTKLSPFWFIFLWLVMWMSFWNMFTVRVYFSSGICVFLYLPLFILEC